MKFAWVLLGLVVTCGSARAGVYSTADGDDFRLSINVTKFFETFNVVRSIGIDKVEKDNPLRKRYFLYEALGGARPPNDLTLEQKLDYSAVLIRRKKFQQAIEYLTPLTRQHPEIFLFDCHLAMAYWGSGQPGNDRRALDIQSQVLSKRGWPATFGELSPEQKPFFENAMGWNEGPFDFYRKTETYLLKLMKLRLAEPAGAPFDSVDAIFDDGKKPAKAVRFVNDDGKFEPGRTSAAELRKLPPAALENVEQLLLWLPEDLRLYWLLGELANTKWTRDQLNIPDDPNLSKSKRDLSIANRDVAIDNMKASDKIFRELVLDFQIRVPDLRDRRHVLNEFIQTVPVAPPSIEDFDVEVTKAKLKDDPAIAFNPRTIATTFVAGMAVGIFAIWQFQEFRRRRRGG